MPRGAPTKVNNIHATASVNFLWYQKYKIVLSCKEKNKNFEDKNQFFTPMDDYVSLRELVRKFSNLYEIAIHSDKDYIEILHM